MQREQHVQRPKSGGGAHVGGIRRKPVWQYGPKAMKEDFGVMLKEQWGPNGGPVGLILFGKELPLQSHAPGEAQVWALTRGLPRPVQCLC